MEGYDFTGAAAFKGNLPQNACDKVIALICESREVNSLMDVFSWDKSTVIECENIDETVRYTSYDGYDFLSLIYAERQNGELLQREINVFFAENYLAAVFPADMPPSLSKLRADLTETLRLSGERAEPLKYLYYFILSALADSFSDILERLEDEMEDLSEEIEGKPTDEHSAEIGRLRKTAYTLKKLLRATAYVGGQIVVGENKLLDKKHTRRFKNIDERFLKLYDFADSLMDLSNELLHTYDSKLSAKMNETVNKLTIMTLFFGPTSLIAGIYGMNFAHMPELGWAYGYPASIALMVLISAVIYIVLKVKKWL
ncbi:MAG: magnesium transporter CorA family protein [Clostridiales bacterium]|jgi:magnesium transporter|nr:magnesium transporter CorA family protein [Clostridiales bacterium]